VKYRVLSRGSPPFRFPCRNPRRMLLADSACPEDRNREQGGGFRGGGAETARQAARPVLFSPVSVSVLFLVLSVLAVIAPVRGRVRTGVLPRA